jgi:hypothetical protein
LQKILVLASTRNKAVQMRYSKLRNRDGFPAPGGFRRMSLLTATARKVDVILHSVPVVRLMQSHGRPKVRGAAHRPHTIRIRQAHSKGHRMLAVEAA